eukprot:scaffold31_cov263-Pinguiococcus_pyrenoidosus.AAC.44
MRARAVRALRVLWPPVRRGYFPAGPSWSVRELYLEESQATEAASRVEDLKKVCELAHLPVPPDHAGALRELDATLHKCELLKQHELEALPEDAAAETEEVVATPLRKDEVAQDPLQSSTNLGEDGYFRVPRVL